MKPLNQKERTSAFLKVVGLFLLCFVIAMFLGFMTMNIKSLEDSKTRGDLEKLKSELKFQQETFAPNIDQVTKIMAKVPVYKEQGENIEILNQDIASLLSTTKNKVTADDSWQSAMYLNILKVYSDLQLNYKEQLKLKEQLEFASSNTQGSDKDLQRCLDEKRTLQNEITMLKLTAASAGGGGSTAASGGNVAELEKQLRLCKVENKSLLSEITKLRNK